LEENASDEKALDENWVHGDHQLYLGFTAIAISPNLLVRIVAVHSFLSCFLLLDWLYVFALLVLLMLS